MCKALVKPQNRDISGSNPAGKAYKIFFFNLYLVYAILIPYFTINHSFTVIFFVSFLNISPIKLNSNLDPYQYENYRQLIMIKKQILNLFSTEMFEYFLFLSANQ